MRENRSPWAHPAVPAHPFAAAQQELAAGGTGAFLEVFISKPLKLTVRAGIFLSQILMFLGRFDGMSIFTLKISLFPFASAIFQALCHLKSRLLFLHAQLCVHLCGFAFFTD